MGLFDTIINIIGLSGSDERTERRDLLISDLQSVSDRLSSYTKNLTGLAYSYTFKDITSECKDLERRAESELRTFRFIKGPAYQRLKSYYDSLLDAEKDFSIRIQDHNNHILQQRISDAYDLIQSVEGRKLDLQQMACIVKNPHSQLVIAGAGTGKTTTIIGKVKYLLATRQVLPQELLILSFTNAAAAEMKNRLLQETNQKIYVATFHKLGYDIVRHADKITPKVCQKDIRSFTMEDLSAKAKDPGYQRKLIQYLLFHQVKEKSEFEFQTESEYLEYLAINPPVTIFNEHVKSYGEMTIANFLAGHGIRYEYERPYPIDTRTEDYGQYMPDFYLPDYDIYIEYYGINRNGKVPDYFSGTGTMSASERYREGMLWKRSLHEQNGTKLIECYAYEHMDGKLLEVLQKRLTDAGVNLKQLSLQELLDAAGQKEKSVLSMLADVISTVITLCRNRRYTSLQLLEQCRREMPKELALAELTTPIMDDYEKYLRDQDLVDFADMLNRAEDLTITNTFIHKFKYVIVDEYQDLSTAQFRLLQAMRQQSDYTLFCVGDDWQSIYRFAGSDIGYTLQFDKYWGDSELDRIETTYRFSQRLIDISGGFIMKNPNQIKKYIHSGNDTEKLVLGRVDGYTESAAMRFMAEKLEMLPNGSTVYLIGRYQFDADLLKKCDRFTVTFDNVKNAVRVSLDTRKDLTIYFYTAHRSKGLQADYVFIINNRSTHFGFPSKVQNPPLIELLLEQADQYPDAEERRLYYVALTRAKKRVYLVTIGKSISTFAQELISEYEADIKQEAWSCPWCGGKLRKVSGPYGEFFGCSNYKTKGCKYWRKILPGRAALAEAQNPVSVRDDRGGQH